MVYTCMCLCHCKTEMDTPLLLILLIFLSSTNFSVCQPGRGTGSNVSTLEYGEFLTIVSPNYPDNYPSQTNNHWLVSGPADSQLMAVFNTFDLEDSYDILKIGSGLDQSDTSSLLATLSGSSLPSPIFATNNEMWLVFTSDSSVTMRGFEVNISVFVPENFTDLGTGSNVNTLEYGEFLTIVSPNYPDSYPSQANSHWLFSGPEDSQLMAVFSTFDLEDHYDILKIGSGLNQSDTSSLLATLSGSSLPSPIFATNNEIWLVFTSDSSVTMQGFEVNISIFTPENFTDLANKSSVFGHGESLTIVSPNYPRNYPNNDNTYWLVSGPENFTIMAVFRNFHLQDNYDKLRIGWGLHPNDSTTMIADLSGSALPPAVVTPGNEMWLVFTSDSEVARHGFMIDISIFTPGNVTDYLTYSPTLLFGEPIDANVTVLEMFFADTCFEESCFRDFETRVCSCDEICQFFGDCCPDYPVPILNETLTNETAIDLDVWECIVDSPLPPFYPNLGHGYRMIARCPSKWSFDEEIKQKCEDVPPNSTQDVLYIHEDTYFRNLACAICHGFNESVLTSIAISSDQQCSWGNNNILECITQTPKPQSNVSMNLNESDVIMLHVQTVPKPRLCLFNKTQSCPNGTNNEIALECQFYHKPFISEGIVSKHPACHHCNGGPLITCPITRSIDTQPFAMDEPMVEVGVFDVFRFEPNGAVMPIPGDIFHCVEGFELDENGYCIPISSDWPICQLEHIWVTQNTEAEECLEDILCFRQVVMDNFTLSLAFPPPCLTEPLTSLFNDNKTFSMIYQDGINPSLETIQRDIVHRVQPRNRNQCENMVISASRFCYVEDNLGNLTKDCPEELLAGQYLDFTPFLIDNETFVFSNGTYIRPRWWSNMTNIAFGHTNVSSEYHFILCGAEVALQTCSFFTVSNDSVEWTSQDNQSAILYQGQVYDTENFLVNPDGSINLCYIDQGTSTDGRTLMISGHIFFAISSVFLFATLITYIAFPTLRNRQGVCIMNFIVALLIGQILLQYIRLAFSKVSFPCVIVAALSHFFILASFVWTTILAWDLSRCFAASKMKSFSSSSFGCKMVVFLLIGWGTPLAVVSITLLLQFGGFHSGPDLEYDINRCWLNRLASIIMFFVPVAVCLLTNLVLFIITIHGVHSTKKTTSTLHRQESSTKQWFVELKIYVKISALLGFAWLFGFLAMVITVAFMEYLFVVVMGLQGVFIFISFGANKRVKKLWRTSIESSTLWTTLSRREYSQGRSTTRSNDGKIR